MRFKLPSSAKAVALSLLAVLSFYVTSFNSVADTAAWAQPEKELMVPVEGGNIYVRLNGLKHKNATPVIFIHGGPGGTHNGFAGMTELANDRMVIMYD